MLVMHGMHRSEDTPRRPAGRFVSPASGAQAQVTAALASDQIKLYPLTDVLTWHACDVDGSRYRLVDLAVDISQNYPPITHILLRQRHGSGVTALPWSMVRDCDPNARLIRIDQVRDRHFHALHTQALGHDLLRRDLLDAWVLNLTARIVARANQLLLQLDDHTLELRAVDIRPQALLKRLARSSHLSQHQDRKVIDWESVVFLRGTIQALSSAAAGEDQTQRAQKLSRALPAEIARLSDALPYLHAAELLTLLSPPHAADMLEALALDRQVQVFAELNAHFARSLLALMAPDTSAQLLSRLPLDEAQKLLATLPQPKRQHVLDLLRFPEGTAASLMTNDVLMIPVHMNAGEAITLLQPGLMEPDFTTFIYVVDDLSTQHLRGVVSLRQLVAADVRQPVSELMRPNLIVLPPLEPDLPAAFTVIESQLAALPVVASDGRLLGAVPVDAAIARIVPPQLRSQLPRIFS